jgi:putative membrane protein
VILRLLISALTLWVVVRLVPGISYTGPEWQLFLVAIVFGGVNAVLKPILTALTCPLILLTFGLFTLVVNAVLLLIAASLSRSLGLGFEIAGFWPAFWGGLVLGVTGSILTVTLADRKGE